MTFRRGMHGSERKAVGSVEPALAVATPAQAAFREAFFRASVYWLATAYSTSSRRIPTEALPHGA